jgi:hypothetical protein
LIATRRFHVPSFVAAVVLVNVAVTAALLPDIVTTQDPVPEQAPDQPTKVEFADGVAKSVTVEPAANPALQVAPQAIPAGVDATLPLPVPARLAVKAGCTVTDTFGHGELAELVRSTAHTPKV